MGQSIRAISLLVRDYDEAIAFFTGCLRFAVVEDTPLGDGKRWVLVAPPGDNGPALLLARAATAEQESRIGNQTGGRVFLFLHTDDFWRDYQEMKSRGVRFTEEPRREADPEAQRLRDEVSSLRERLRSLEERLGKRRDEK